MDYIPCVVWGRCARFCAHLGRGTMLEATGRLQSREYVTVLDGVTYCYLFVGRPNTINPYR